jgi:hypothetical protein
MSWVNNAWVVGIASGVPSGLLVAWLLSLFLSKKKDREYRQQVTSANREVIYAMRSGIPDNALPTHRVVEALINSTARRYGFEAADLYTPEQLAEELIKEVMDSSFLSSAKKSEYCTDLSASMTPESNTALDVAEVRGILPENSSPLRKLETAQRESEIRSVSAIVGIAGGVVSAWFALRALVPTLEGSLHLVGKSLTLSIISIVFLLTCAMFFYQVLERIKIRRIVEIANKAALDATRATADEVDEFMSKMTK